MKKQEDMKHSNLEIPVKRKDISSSSNNNNISSSQPDPEGFHQISRMRHDTDLDLDLSLGPRRISPGSLLSSSSSSSSSYSYYYYPCPQLLPPHQKTPQLFPSQAPATTLLRSHTILPATSHTGFTHEPTFHAGAAVIAPSLQSQEGHAAGPSRAPRSRRNPSNTPRNGKSETISPPFPWATNRRAMVHSLDILLSRNIEIITGAVQCKKCEKQYEMEFNLKKFDAIGKYIAENKSSMHDRAPNKWMNPILPTCKYCKQENSVKPLISEKKKSINWLFLLLGEMLGCCTLEQLKYFCKHTKNHRTGAKDRVLYLTYLGFCKQLDPNGPFDR
ncbi:hypothetical protein MANES_15G164900v8 [Manihot esculenta]|uniref:DUF7086 domain-containing protein n=1 Tax=Manihot esculenta TaxID=3983 RepID=A0A2C9UGU7_MANES|nr:hypothetical protein MANES_15G164900v8 [Manihot esculenta]